MSSTQFKLSKKGGLTRRIAFPSRPSWQLLSSRIGELYEIPIEKIAVSYIDKDGDEVTLSSEEELSDFYIIEASNQAQAPIKFVVQDLRSLRDSQHESSTAALPDTPQFRDNIRNTFGGVFDIDEDWQLPSLGFFKRSGVPGPETQHAFVEVLESEVNDRSGVGTDQHKDKDATIDKGKSRAYEPSISDTVSSTGSVLAEDAPPKPPVHVYDLSSHKDQSVETSADLDPGISSTPKEKIVSVPAESTPKAAVQSLNTTEAETAQGAAPDPPLPSLDIPEQTPTTSLSRDVAALLDSFSRAISSHPEISSAVHTIVHNTANGSYWQAHRHNIANAAEQIARQAQDSTGRATEEIRRITEEDAGRRVAEALGEFFRLFSGMTGGRTSDDTSAAGATPGGGPANPVTPAPPPAGTFSQNIWPPRPPPHGPPFEPSSSSWDTGRHGAPHVWGGPPSGPWGSSAGWKPWWAHHSPTRTGRPSMFQPPPPPPPFSNMPLYPPPLFHPPPGGALNVSSGAFEDPSKMTEQALRTDLELTKQRYKAEKELYRSQREERRKDKERRRDWNDGDNTARFRTRDGDKYEEPATFKPSDDVSVTQIVSNARGPYPQLEMVSVPTKRNRSFAKRNPAGRGPEMDADTVAIQRITKRLADMGFMTHAYPLIPTRIKDHIPPNGNINKDVEDDIVTTMLEELLAMSPKPPAASSSRPRKDRDIPGAWH